MRVLDLFSGIGGMSLGLERAGMKTVAFCEIEPYCRAVLRKHWPAVPVFDDVRMLNSDVLRFAGVEDPIDVICGGFPCQDISLLGRGAGINGERSGLWREFARLIGELRPRYVLVENVAALLGRGLGEVLADLAALGFDAQWHCIPACAVGAPHQRDRLWIIAYPGSTGRTNDQGRPGHAREGGGRLAASDAAEHWVGQWLSEPAVDRVVSRLSADVDAVAALGNAVVPQIPEIIGRAILMGEA